MQRAAQNATDPVDPPRLAAPLSSLPWDLAQEEFGVAGADFLGSMGRLLLVGAKDEIHSQVPDATGESTHVAAKAAKDEIRSQVPEPTGESAQVVAGAAKDEIRAVAG
jgi:hypothetical protein